MSYLERAKAIFNDVVQVRKQIHRNPEVGFDLPETVKTVQEKLNEYGIACSRLGDSCALVGTLGDSGKGKTLLLRADMDALPMKEKSDHAWVSQNENAHLCGHDMHTAILLAALKLLKEDEDRLKGQIKFLFQPAEETLNGGKLMLEKGILDNPRPDAGMAVHMWPTAKEVGLLIPKKEVLASALNFKITVRGKGAHGAMPYSGVDPVFVGAQIVNNANGIIARELPSNKGASLSMGSFNSIGGAVNIIPDTVEILGTSRSLYAESARHMAERLPQVVDHTARAFRAEADYEALADVPALTNTESFSELVKAAAEEALGTNYPVEYVDASLASEDYAHIASQLPQSCYYFIGCPLPDAEGNIYPLHNPRVLFNEEAIIAGSASMAAAAVKWLEDNK
ncbi:MAG: M20 metallopeptidase family protein [Christensenellales bacterium]